MLLLTLLISIAKMPKMTKRQHNLINTIRVIKIKQNDFIKKS